MKKMMKKRAAALFLALLTVLLLAFTGCGGNKNNDDPSPLTSSKIDVNPSDKPEEVVDTTLKIPSRTQKVKDAYAINTDVVGWIFIPGLKDVDAGVTHTSGSYYYNKRDITGKSVKATYWIDGAYYTHLRNKFGATSNELSTNTVVFGHSDLGLTNKAYADDDATGPLFSQLFNFKDPSFAEKTPYIYFSTPENDYVWEVFSVFYNDSHIDDGKALWYIEPEPGKNYSVLLDTAKSRSLYNYDVEVSTEDKILTLSTCTVGYGLGNRARYRFVIMAKLVKDTANLQLKNASFKINEKAPIPSTYDTEFKGYIKNWKPSEALVTAQPDAALPAEAPTTSEPATPTTPATPSTPTTPSTPSSGTQSIVITPKPATTN